jgi:co-chaperonin GroES (HSP10)
MSKTAAEAKGEWKKAFDEELNPPVANPSGLEPLGHAVLIAPYEPEFKKSIIEIPITVRMRTQMAETRAIIIAVGPEAWAEEKSPRARVGDKVMVTRCAGAMLTGPNDEKIYRMVNDRDIYARISSEAWPETEQLEATNER